MLCPKCKGILDIVKVYEEDEVTNNKLCDVQCLKCGHKIYSQPYYYGTTLNVVPSQKK